MRHESDVLWFHHFFNDLYNERGFEIKIHGTQVVNIQLAKRQIVPRFDNFLVIAFLDAVIVNADFQIDTMFFVGIMRSARIHNVHELLTDVLPEFIGVLNDIRHGCCDCKTKYLCYFTINFSPLHILTTDPKGRCF
jgi:hypothetical protein